MSTPNPTEETLFHRALALPAEARADFLRRECHADESLRASVESLLRLHGEVGRSFLEQPAPELAATIAATPRAEEKPGDVIGRYKLLQKIGEGGCGAVYMAEQQQPVVRRVALKVIKLGMDTKAVIARFEAERQALAMMDHPNIAKVLDAGTTDAGRPFFVMELVRGLPITRYCDEASLPTARRLELFTQVCQAIQHAHQKGIIHRDIKPSNILVTLHDGVPVPKVIDFGIAKATQGRLTDQTLFTAFEQFIGTPAYMSPEQTELSGLDIDTRSDIYSLGVLLYELLTGRPPFDPKTFVAAGLDEIRRVIREVDPPRPSTRLGTLTDMDQSTVAKLRGTAPAQLSTVLAGDLDWIVMRCLEKDRTRRYPTPSELSADIVRHLRSEPVVARPPSAAYLIQKLVRRHRVACAAAGVIVVALITGLVATAWAYSNEKNYRQIAVEAARLQRLAGETSQESFIKNARLREDSEANARAAAEAGAKFDYARALLAGLADHPDAATRRAALDLLAARFAQDRASPPAARHQIAEMLGDAYAAIEAWPQAEGMYRQALAGRRELLGEADPATTAALKKLVEALRRQGKGDDAARVEGEARGLREAFVSSERWTRILRARERDEYARGDYAAAIATLDEAIGITRRSLGEKYDERRDLMQLADLKFTAGDDRGAAEAAERCVQLARTTRRWFPASELGWVSITNPYVYPAPSNAYALLGLIALKAGDREAAKTYLQKSATGLSFYFALENPLDRRHLELASGLLAAGERPAVLEFLDRLDSQLVANLKARGFNVGNFTMHQTQRYANAAAGQDLAARLARWREDVAAGRVPSDWSRSLQARNERTPALLLPSDSFFSRLRETSRALPSTPLAALPFGVLLLGWCTAATAARPASRRARTATPAIWLAAFCMFRAADCGLFLATLLGEGWRDHFGLRATVALLGWLSLWEFVRRLRPETTSRREAWLVRGGIATALGAVLAVELLEFMFTSESVEYAVVVGIFLGGVTSALVAMAVPVAAGVRLWQWSGVEVERGGRRTWIRLAAVLLGAQGFSALYLPLFCDLQGNPAAAIVLWLNAALPWLLLLLVSPRRARENERAPVLEAA